MPIKRPTPVVSRRIVDLESSGDGLRGYGYPAKVPLLVEAGSDRVLVGSARLENPASPTLPCWLVEVDPASAEALRSLDQATEPLPSQVARAAAAMQKAGLLLTEIQAALDVSDVTTASRWAAMATLPAKVLKLLDARHITFGHARLLIGLPEASAVFLVGECVAHGWTNARLRQAIRGETPDAGPDTTAFAQTLTRRLGSECTLLWPDNPAKRRLVIEYFDTEALKGIFEQLAIGPERARRNAKRQLEIALQDVDELEALTGHLTS